MSKKIAKCVIIGITALFLISALNPVLIQNVKAADPPVGDLVVTTNVGEIYECNDFTVTVRCNGNYVEAHVYYCGEGKTGSTVQFEAASVDSPKGIPVQHRISAECEFDSDGDGINETHAGETTINVLNRYLEVTSVEVEDNENFDIHVAEIGNGGIKGGVSVVVDTMGDRTTGPLGNTLTKFQAPVHAPEAGKYIEYHISATKDDFIPDNSGIVKVKNINIKPNTPDKPKAGGLLDIFHVAKPVIISTSTNDPDTDEVKYTFNWGDGSGSLSEYATSGNEVSLSHTYTMQVPDGPKEVFISARAEDNGVDENGNSDPKSSGDSLPQMIKIINEQPSIAQVSGDTEFPDTTATLTFTGRDSANEDHPIYFQIHWGDGSNERYPSTGSVDSGTSFSRSHTYEPGKYCVSMTVHDIYGKSKGSNSHCIVVDNLPPNTPSLTVRKMDGKGAYMAHVTTTDPNEEDTFYFVIIWNGEGSSNTGQCDNSNNGASASHTFSSGGLKKITAYAVDQDGAKSGIATKWVTVILLTDAAMAMSITLPLRPTPLPTPTPIPTPNVIYQMVPKTFINEQGQVTRLDDSYSVEAHADGTYVLKQNNQAASTNLESSTALQEYIVNNYNSQTGTTGITPVNNNQNSGGTGSNPTSIDSDGDGTPDSSDPCPYDPDNKCNNNNGPDSAGSSSSSQSGNGGTVSYSIYATEEIPCLLCDEDDADANKENENNEDATEKTDDATRIDVTVQFDGSGTLLYLNEQEQVESEIQIIDEILEIQNDEKQQHTLNSRPIGVYNLLQSLLERFPALSKFTFIQKIIEEKSTSSDDKKQKTDVPKESNLPCEENIDNDVSDKLPSITAVPSQEENPENIISDESAEVNNVEDKYSSTPEPSLPELLEEESIVFLWDFGDGEIGMGIKPIHTYHINTEPASEPKQDAVESSLFKYSFGTMIGDIPKENVALPINDPTAPTEGGDADDEANDKPDLEIEDEIIGGTETEDAESTSKLAKYLVTLYVVIDEKGILENIENIDKSILSQVEILGSDTTTITIEQYNKTPSQVELLAHKCQIDEIERLHLIIDMHF